MGNPMTDQVAARTRNFTTLLVGTKLIQLMKREPRPLLVATVVALGPRSSLAPQSLDLSQLYQVAAVKTMRTMQ